MSIIIIRISKAQGFRTIQGVDYTNFEERYLVNPFAANVQILKHEGDVTGSGRSASRRFGKTPPCF